MTGGDHKREPPADVAVLRERLTEAVETLEAIRSGQVDALVTTDGSREQIFTLRTADQPFRILVENMSEGAALVAADSLILYSNNRLAHMLGLPPERVTGRMLLDLVPEPERNGCLEMLRRGLIGPWHCESQLIAPSRFVPVLFSASKAVVDGTAQICLVVTDLTTQRQNEAIVASERLARSILDQAAEAIVVCNQRGEIIRTNEAARELCPDIETGAIFDTAVRLDAAPGVDCTIASVLRGSPLQGIEAGLQGAVVIVNAGPLTGPSGEIIGAVITLTDFTDRKHYEERLQQQSEDLARSNADLERFAFLASHDLQEPLRMVNTYTQLLLRKHPERSGEQAMFAGYIEAGVNRMRQLIDDLLAYSRVTQQSQMQLCATDANAILSEALASLRAELDESGAEVIIESLPRVLADASQLYQVFVHLLDNAIRYREDVRPVIRISAKPGGDVHTFSVRDNGPGIAPRYHRQIFTLFKRLRGWDLPGSGVGLALCKRIIEAHGGRIWVESTPGDGAAFRFTLPAAMG